MSGIHLPVVATQPKAPIIEVQTASVARPSDWARAIEKLSSTQKALKGRLAAETSSQRVSADKVLASRPIALRERPAANKASGWATAIDKVLLEAARDHNPRDLLSYMDQFVAKLH